MAAKGAAPKIPLYVLLLAPMLLDILWAIFHFAGANPNIWTHGLFMALVWSLATATISGFAAHSFRTGLILGLLVFSHWIIDFFTHPMGFIFPEDTGVPLLFEGSPVVGIGLYNSLGGVIAGEAILIIPGIIIYLMALHKKKFGRNKASEQHKQIEL